MAEGVLGGLLGGEGKGEGEASAEARATAEAYAAVLAAGAAKNDPRRGPHRRIVPAGTVPAAQGTARGPGLRPDRPGAERAWNDGLRVSPDLPFVYLARGLSEQKRGDLKAAEADLEAASARAPHFADPLKAWGDLLAQENRWPEALAKYDAALKYAPAWAELHQALDTAARNKKM